ncbi:GAF domain-containing SpoIIE family protein phosphatase [candidate division KSB1 bacterium]
MEPEILKHENLQLRRAVDELAFLNELSGTIGASFNSEEIMQTIIRKSIRAIKAEQGAITLVEEDGDKELKTLVRTMVSSSERNPFSLGQNLFGWMHINKKPLAINDVHNDERFRGVEWEESIRSVICVPLLLKSKLVGILSVYNKKAKEGFSEDDSRLLAIIAGQSAQVIENARLYEEEQALIKFKEEARLAAEIQRTLLPKSDPDIPGYDIAGRSIPALSVGGDYFDFIAIDDNNIAVCLGDISGKGMPAALLMSNLQATIRGQVFVGGTAKDCVCRSNKLLYRSTDPNKFATFFYGILDHENNKLCYTNAGHNPPLFFQKSQEPDLLRLGGPVLGFLEDLEYLDDIITLDKGDLVCIYSDGITEAMDNEENEFGEEHLVKLISDNRDLGSSEIIQRIIVDVNRHSEGFPQSDDITIVVIKRVE